MFIFFINMNFFLALLALSVVHEQASMLAKLAFIESTKFIMDQQL